MSSAGPPAAHGGRRGLLLLSLISVGVSLAIGWFFRADYYVGELRDAAADVERADTPEHRAALLEVENRLVELGAPSRGRIYRELSDGSAATLSFDRALVRCALRSYQARPASDEEELLGALTLALQRQPGGSGGIWDELSGLELELWNELACRVWPGLTPAERRALAGRSAQGVAPRCSGSP